MNNIDLSQPARQSVKGLILIFFTSLRKGIKAFWPLILLYVIQNNLISNKLIFFVSGLIILILLIVHSVLYYLNFYFFVLDNEFILKKGYWRKQTLNIPLERIQSVNTKQNLLQQLLNVVSLEIDTAGATGKELKIHALKKEFVEALQNRIKAGRDTSLKSSYADNKETASDESSVIMRLTPFDLLKIGISQNHIKAGLVLLIFGFQIFQQIADVFKDKADQYSNKFIGFISHSSWALIAFMVVFFIVVSIFFSLARTILKYFDFNLTKRENSYQVQSGLINKRNVLVPLNKVQELNWSTNPLMKIFGIYHLVFRQAVSGQNRRRQLTDAPGCLQTHIDSLKNDLFGADKLSPLPPIFSNRYYFRRLWILYGWLPTMLVLPFLFNYVFFQAGAIIWLAITAMYSYLTLKKRYFQIDAEQIRISKGAFSQKWKQMELYKIQSVEVKQTLFQRRRALASLRLMNSAGTINIPFINEQLAYNIYNYLLYHTEISEKSWM